MVMNRQKLLLAVLGVLLVIVAFVNYRYFFGGKTPVKTEASPPPKRGGKAAVAAKKEKGVIAEPTTTTPKVRFEPIPVDASLLEGKLASGEWGREPFLTPAELQPPPEEVKPPEPEVPLTVNSILVSKDQKVAVINGSLYSVGELVTGTGHRVVDIKNGSVLLEKEGITRQVPMRQSTIEIKSREK
jgi:type II secretory pathway component PulC